MTGRGLAASLMLPLEWTYPRFKGRGRGGCVDVWAA